ncbi:hemolysin family protein [Bacillus salinus]|uniref:hemolysin family protein n=1 Tax=Bacillus sp. HMF5848 TaxID=2495421 RepID=UPI001639909C|nr:hemolysin family protein [Bacillus sp. HMF5848]
MILEILLLVVLIVLNAFFAASEIALISLNDNKIKLMAESGHKKAQILHSLLSEPSRFLATIQIGITLAGFLASAFAAESFASRLALLLTNIGVPIGTNVLENVSVVVITLVLSYFTLVFGELVPKRLAMQKAEPVAMFAATSLFLLSKITSPFVKLLTGSMNVIVRLFGVDPNADDDEVTEEEIRMMVDVGKERGTIQETEKFMINNIFEFDNKIVSDIMTHRTNVVGIPINATLKEVVKTINQERYTRFPVYEGDLDNIEGILHTKDIIQYMENGDEFKFDLRRLTRTPYFVPASKPTDELLKDLQKNQVHLAVVIDEYGGTDGIVTLEDLIEEIVGNIFDEYDVDEREIVAVDNNTFMVKGTASLYDIQQVFDVSLPTDDYDTISGFVIGQLGMIPESADIPLVEYGGLVFKIEELDEKRIKCLKVCRSD